MGDSTMTPCAVALRPNFTDTLPTPREQQAEAAMLRLIQCVPWDPETFTAQHLMRWLVALRIPSPRPTWKDRRIWTTLLC